MNQYVTGATIKELREKRHLTQAELSAKLNVSDKAVSKWETGKGYPDITLLEPLSKVFDVSITELLAGRAVVNANVSANMLKSVFYICPVCGNVIHCMGETAVSCHGIMLSPAEAEAADAAHKPVVERLENEYYVTMDHEMSKNHYISFIAAVSTNGIQMVKLYPEENAEARFVINGVAKIFYYCNKDGLFVENICRKDVEK